MTNVSHASLTGSQLHEPKGADAAAQGTVYVANGAGSGSWNSIGTSSFTGMIADFVAVVPPTGWLELDGSIVSTSTYSALYSVLATQTSGTRTNGSAIVTSISDTSKFAIGYYVFGTGIASGTTILNIDSGTQITLSAAASSSGTAVFAVSPCLLNTGTIKLPDTKTSGRYRRSRSASTKPGDFLASQNKAHTHGGTFSGSADSGGSHQHSVFLRDTGHSHSGTVTLNTGAAGSSSVALSSNAAGGSTTESVTIGSGTTGITIGSVSGAGANDNKTASDGAHTHTVSGSISAASDGGTEARPDTIVVITCIKT